MISERIEHAYQDMRALEARRYHIGSRRWEAVREARGIFATLFDNLANGVLCLAKEILLHPEATYLVVNLCGGHDPSMQRGVIQMRRVGFVSTDGILRAIDLTNGEDLGEINRLAVTPRDAWPNEWWHSGNPVRDRAYTGLVFGSPDRHQFQTQDRFALPLTGPALKHPAFARMAAFAHDLLHDRVQIVNVLRALDADNVSVAADYAAADARARNAIDDAIALHGANAGTELVKLIQSMDWTFDYADRPNPRFYDQRAQISEKLQALAPEQAIAYLDAAQHSWQDAYRLLRRSAPGLKAAA